jgi:Cu+-exporting ATPase
MRYALLITFLAACGSAPAPAKLDAAALSACIDAADLADGADDATITKCANCNLKMDGDAAFAVDHAGHSFHLCSEGCKSKFEADPAAVIARSCPK